MSLTEQEVVGQVYRTRQYDLLRLDPTNRPINERHLQRLVNKIARKNKLHANPILVNQHGWVLDGQHRLEAARHLGLYIYYIISSDTSIIDVPGLNSIRMGWRLVDFLNHYESVGKEEYIKLGRLWRESCRNLPLSVMAFLSQNSNQQGSVLTSFREGEYELQDGEFPKYISLLTEEVENLTGIRSSKLSLALAKVAGNPRYDHKRMEQKLKERASANLHNEATIDGYVRSLQNIYNNGLTRRNRVLFVDL